MKEIPLTHGYVAKVDDDDYPILATHRWQALYFPERRTVYARRDIWVNRERHSIMMHRFILNPPKDLEVDHRDNDGLNCQKGNLRLATHAQNQRNTPKYRNNKSGFKGVHWEEDRQKWTASIRVNGKEKRIGSFDSPELAAMAYDRAALKFHQEFASLNQKPPK